MTKEKILTMYREKKYKYLVIVLLLHFMAVHSVANDKYHTLYNQCIDKAGSINNAIVTMCSEKVSTIVKKDMNRLYKMVYQKISALSMKDAEKFKNTQKNWLKYRKSHCELMGEYVGSPMYSYCPMQLNIARVKALQELGE